MSDPNLPDSLVDALARLWDELPPFADAHNDFFLVRAELSKSALLIRGHEKTIRRLELDLLKAEETILYQGDRLLAQHRAAQQRDHELEQLRVAHARLVDDHNHLTVRDILARLMGRKA